MHRFTILVILAPIAAIVALALQHYILAIILLGLSILPRLNPTMLRAGVLCYKAPRPKQTMRETIQFFPQGEPVGKGWGFFLQKRSPTQPILMHCFFQIGF